MGDNKEVAVVQNSSMELSVADVRNQVAKIQGLMKDLMQDGEHYGVIPGTQKPSLFKAGAEKIGFIFRLVPEFTITRDDLSGGHREYQIVCALRHANTGTLVGQGVGSCSTMESKYRWRNVAVTEEVGAPPKAYWDTPKDDFKARSSVLEGTFGQGKYQVKKKDGAWVVLKVTGDGDRVENPDIADLYNTVLKMAKKRAFVDATITATAASDFFTQDVEDFRQEQSEGSATPPPAPESKPSPAPKAQTAKPTPAQPEQDREVPATKRQEVNKFLVDNTERLTEEQRAELRKMFQVAGTTPALLEQVQAKASEYIALNVGGWDDPEPEVHQTVEDIPHSDEPGLGIF